MNFEEQRVVTESYEERRRKSEVEFIEFISICLDEGWAPTKCPEGCPVEPDGICPHGFKSVALEFGFIESGRINRIRIQNYGSDY